MTDLRLGVWEDGDKTRRLVELWAEGVSAKKIGDQLGVSKNAVVGKAKRLDLARRPSPIHGVASSPVRVPPKPRVRPARTVAAIAPRPVAVRTCQRPLWGNLEKPTHRYCGEPVQRSGASYCAACERTMYTRSTWVKA